MSDEKAPSTESSKDDHDSTSSASSSPLKPAIRSFVDATNSFLASLQDTTESIRRPVLHGIDVVEQEGSYAARQALRAFQRRHEFGPYLVLGTGLLVGGVVAARRGRLPAVFASTLAGGMVYLGVYETPVEPERIPDIIFGERRSSS